MTFKIRSDVERFHRKLAERRHGALKGYIETDRLTLPRPDGRVLQIPVPRIVIPRFTFGTNEGVGQGPGEEGDILGPLQPGDEPYKGGAIDSDLPHDHEYVPITREEVAQFLAEHLKLPNLRETLGSGNIEVISRRYSGIAPVGPQGLRHFKRTYKRALQRAIASGTYKPGQLVIPRKEDMRYKSPRDTLAAAHKAVAVFLLDCSGSMMTNIEFLQQLSWWTDCWLDHGYNGVERRYIHYDNFARESTSEEFYHIRAGGENHMGVAFARVHQIFSEYPIEEWDRYVVLLTDGDDYGLVLDQNSIGRYTSSMNLYPNHFPQMPLQPGNPLTDLILPECNAVFVCEAGAYYGPQDRWRGNTNITELLIQLANSDPTVARKLRFVSFEDHQIETHEGRRIMNAIETWFGNRESHGVVDNEYFNDPFLD